MAQKHPFLTKIIKLQERYNLPSVGKPWQAITRQQIELESYLNPLKTREVLYFRMKKNNFKLWVCSFWSMTSRLRYVLQLFITSSPNQWADLVAQSFLDSRIEYKSLEPLIDFLAFLVQKQRQKNSKYSRNSLED